MGRYSVLTAVLTLGFMQVGSALASDINPPSWRGQPASTFQDWQFDTSANPAVPDSTSNPYGTASASIVTGATSTGWQYDLGYGSIRGYWDLGSQVFDVDQGQWLGQDGRIDVSVPNVPGAPAGSSKLVRIQVTYMAPFDAGVPDITMAGATKTGSGSQLIETVAPFGDKWWSSWTDFSIAPCPDSESITISAVPQQGLLVDQITVDTLALNTPEPATLSGLALALAVLVRRRGR